MAATGVPPVPLVPLLPGPFGAKEAPTPVFETMPTFPGNPWAGCGLTA